MGLRQFVAVLWALVKRFHALTTRCTYIALATVPIFLIALAYFEPVPLEFFNSFAPANNHSTTCTFLYVRTTPARYQDLFAAAYKDFFGVKKLQLMSAEEYRTAISKVFARFCFGSHFPESHSALAT